MRTHGWSGSAPADDDEAVARILAAARRALDRSGTDISIVEVARDLGVTRQTVYRYFPSAEALLAATATEQAVHFLEVLDKHLRAFRDPAQAVVEAIAYTLERLPHERYLGILLTPGRTGVASADVTSDTARAFGRSMLERFDIDWASEGFTPDILDELVEHMLRIVQSFVIDPGRPPRRGAELRGYLATWVAPAVTRLRPGADGPPPLSSSTCRLPRWRRGVE